MQPEQTLGFAHLLAQSDSLGKFILIVLFLMSVASWYLIATKVVQSWIARRRAARFLDFFWNAAELNEVALYLKEHAASDAFSEVAQQSFTAVEHFRKHGGKRLAEAGGETEFLTRALRRAVERETAERESGLTMLASVGSTAPFVGLFGTVWGIYHALVNIGMSGQGTLDKVAGPVGEALIMTALGLAVAIPAVLGYNFFVRGNRMWLAELDAFAHDLFAFLSTGARIEVAARTPAQRDLGLARAAKAGTA